jgi:nitroreductase
MQTWDAITSRRNVRSFADRPIPAADLDRILEAGRRAPSSQNWQPWDFILVTNRDQLRQLAKVWRGAGHVAGSAATIVVVGPAADNEFHRAQLDLGQATMAMLLAAADLGIGSCHAGVADLPLARELLGFPEDRDWALLISLGYPADRPLTRSAVPGGGPSTRWSIATAGKTPALMRMALSRADSRDLRVASISRSRCRERYVRGADLPMKAMRISRAETVPGAGAHAPAQRTQQDHRHQGNRGDGERSGETENQDR